MMNRKVVSLLVGLVVWLLVSLVGQAESKVVELKWNGKSLEFGQAAFMEKGTVFAPARETLEALGATVSWDRRMKNVTAVKGSKQVVLQVGSNRAIVNGKSLRLPGPVQVVNGRAIAPVRAMAEAFEATVEWNGMEQTVNIAESGQVSIQQAEDLVRKHANIAKSSKTIVELDHVDGDFYVIHVYDLVGQHTATRGWYEVEIKTGKVESVF
ncbi:copper amine oxidase N-terminal domain-containing protein [Ammoniphilus sp. CFH 90114]|uniref:copper amine oxidase N-terminal domain-containing protein n=1 Tax=Ammoniphilus sp. CFH 90114 TaxID=2493665 RepID=UPI00100E13B6|nr:copper amine oxidase N-terminal domain-containing protein [Ammoniphilus sp. CFH 90114]RXT04315.1 copper amine oxidase N-terminal domain-containing protein [Ammoniphilus sp. CFH 90114]